MRQVALAATLAALALSAAAEEKRPLNAEDLWAFQRVSGPALSPDGSQAAYAVTTYDMEENRGNADVWIVPVAGGAPRRLTTSKASDSAPV